LYVRLACTSDSLINYVIEYRDSLELGTGLWHYDPWLRPCDGDLDELGPVPEGLWLARFSNEGRCIQWYRYWKPSNSTSILVRPDGTKTPTRSACELVTTPEEMQQLLHIRDECVTHQIVILALPTSENPSDDIIDILGLGLDMKPPIWDCMQEHSRRTSWRGLNTLPRPWAKDCPVFRIGDHSIGILDAISDMSRCVSSAHAGRIEGLNCSCIV
jgi:hypothetical protein